MLLEFLTNGALNTLHTASNHSMSHLSLKIHQRSTRSIKLSSQRYFKFSLFHPWGWWVYKVNCWIFWR